MQPDCKGGGKTSYMPVDITEPFAAIFARLSARKPEVTREHMALITDRIVALWFPKIRSAGLAQ
jgi:hypothetical protein